MPQRSTKLFMIGAFVMIGFVAAGYLIVKFGEAPQAFTGGTYQVPILFNYTKLVTQGTDVLLNGKRIGQVRDLRFANPANLSEGVLVQAEVEKKYRLPKNISALESQTSPVMGRAVILIQILESRPDAEPLPMDGSIKVLGSVQPVLEGILPASTVPTLERTIQQIGELAAALTPVAKQLEELVKSRPLNRLTDPNAPAVANLSTVTQRLDVALQHLNDLLGDPGNQDNLKVALANIRQASEQATKAMEEFRKLATDAQAVVGDARLVAGDLRKWGGNMDAMVTDVGRKMITMLDAGAGTMRSADQMLTSINQGQGTMGLFIHDNRLYESMVLTMDRLDKALRQFQDILDQWKRGELKFRMF